MEECEHCHPHKEHHHDHSHHSHHHNEEDFKKRFFVSLIFTIPVLILSGPINILDIPFEWIVVTLLSSVVYFYGGKPFFEGALSEIRAKRPGMMTLVAFAITSAFIYSVFGGNFFWELTTLVTVMLLGHWIEAKSISTAMKELNILQHLLPSTAHKVVGNRVVDVPLHNLRVGDVVIVKVGERIPVDGVIVEGETRVDASIVTGESIPETRRIGDRVIGGELNIDGVIKVRVEATSGNTYLDHVRKLIEEALSSRTKVQDLADRAAGMLFYVSLAAGIISFILWYPVSLTFAIERMISVFVISCPHALGLAIPMVVSISTSRLARDGVVLRDRRALEETPKVKYILLDKTGTLTEGKPVVVGYDEKSLRLAAAVERYSEHIIGRAIYKKAEEIGLDIPEARDVKVIPGKGIEGVVEGKKVYVGSLESDTGIYVVVEGEVVGNIELKDVIRHDAKEIVARLKDMGYEVYIISGDKKEITEQYARDLKVDGHFAEVKPHEKLEIVRMFKKRGKTMMVGDGINDAPALAEADVGVAIATGSEITAYTAHVIISSISALPRLIYISRKSLRRMWENLFWAASYNVVAIPAAMGILPGIVISPALAALIMSLSTVIVAFNSLRI